MNAFPTPSFHFIHCKVEIPSHILRTIPQSGENSQNSLPPVSPFYSLTRLEIVPGPVDNPSGSTASPWMIAVFSNSLHPTNSSGQQTPSSVIVRWQLEVASQTLHPKFDEVPSKKNNPQAKVCG